MWEGNPERFMSEYRVSPAEAELSRCTAEHLKPRSEGGSNAASNIVAACRRCNQNRHGERYPLGHASERKGE
jgi:5-methylcytosine-specific restriction endonuclease McrA